MYVCIAEIARLSEELNALKGSEEDRSPMSHDASSSSWSAPTSATTSTSTSGQPIAVLETEDLWLGVQVDTNTCGFLKMYVCMYVCMYEQRYRQAVRDSQESLCILLSEEMDLQLQQQVIYIHT